jgi:Domain of unknown function (DUF6458)
VYTYITSANEREVWESAVAGRRRAMGIGVGLLLIAIGAVLAFAVTAHTNGVDLNTVGWILMAVGLAGILLDMLWWHSWTAWRVGPAYARRTTYVDGQPPVAYPQRTWGRRRVVTHEEDAPPPAGPPPA